MCGIAGLLDVATPPRADVLARMAETLVHRGPDAGGTWAEGPVGLAHRRLAILDLSPAGNQPFHSADGDLVLSYNGELYNFVSLRNELQALGHRFHTGTDTEVVLAAWKAWGPACLERFNGMFAFALWDRRERSLWLVRDRYGIKPLYYAATGRRVAFASEIKALRVDPEGPRGLCLGALREYFTFQNVLTDRTLFQGVRALRPGTWLRFDTVGGLRCTAKTYWDFQFEPDERLTEADATVETRRLLGRAVARQLVADVPVGSYLSGGVDSTSIVAFARLNLPRLQTFTAGFDLTNASGTECDWDERAAAEHVARTWQTDHRTLELSAADMEAALDATVWHLEDLRVGQCYPNYGVAQLARRHVKVALSGCGGDELFAGYPWRYAAALAAESPAALVEAQLGVWQRLVPSANHAEFFRPGVMNESRHEDLRAIVADVLAPVSVRLDTPQDRLNAALYFEARTFLPGLLLVEDRTSMAHALETRVPYLDNDLVEFATRIPPRLKLSSLALREALPQGSRPAAPVEGKRVLRRAVAGLIPDEILARRKQGFSGPDASWFRHESATFVQRVLGPRARLWEFIARPYVEQALVEHRAGVRNHRLLIWSLLSIERWLAQFGADATDVSAAPSCATLPAAAA